MFSIPFFHGFFMKKERNDTYILGLFLWIRPTGEEFNKNMHNNNNFFSK